MTEIDALEKTFSSSPIPTIIIQVNTPLFTIVVANDAYLYAENTDEAKIIIGKDFFETHQHIAEIDDYADVFHSVLITKNAHQTRRTGRDLNIYPILGKDGEVAFIVQQLMGLHEPPSLREERSVASRPDLDLFDFSPVPMWVYDIDTLRILAANKAALADYGYTLDEFLDATVRVLWPAADTPRMEQMVVAKVKKDLPNIATVRHIKRSGEVISVNIHSTPLPSWGKNARIVAAIDVSQKLKNEQAIKMNRDRLRSLLQTTNGIVWEANPGSHHFSYVSQYVEKVLGYSASQWLADADFWKKHICPEDRELVLKARHSSLEVGKTYYAEYRMVNSEGNIVWIRDTFTPIIQDDNVSLRGLMVDISVVKRAMAIDQLDKEILTNSAKEDNSFPDVLKTYIIGIEKQFPGIIFGVMSKRDGKLSNLASPSLSETIIAASEGLPYVASADPENTSETEDAWENFRKIVSVNGFTSILQHPVHNKDGNVVAVFLVYHNHVPVLQLDEIHILERVIALLQVILERREYSTERKEAEKDLKLSNEKYADLFHLSPLPLLVYDLETLQILDVNKAAIEHYGYSSDEFLSFTLRDIRPPQDVSILDDLISKHVKAGHVHSSFTRHVKKSGKIILVNTKGNSITYKGRNARIVVAIDNSERIKAEESLKQSERRFRTMIQEGSDLIVILDQTGKISYISPNILRLFNLDPRDMILTSPFDYIHEDDHDAIKSQLLSIRKDETAKVSPYRVRLKGGEIRWLETIITNKSHDPAIAGIIANSRDVTARMKALLKNKELLDRYNAVAKATSDTIWDSNIPTGRIVWNYSLTEAFGYENTQTSIEWWNEHVHPDDVIRVTKLIDSQLNSQEARWMSEYRFRCADGTYKTVLDRGFIIFSDEGTPIRMIGCMQDITQRVAYVHAIENHNKQLREIAWMQSHLVRAPLARILEITQVLSEGGNDQNKIDEMLSYLSVSAAELDDIIKDIIDKSQNL